jgi:hypothetical protein
LAGFGCDFVPTAAHCPEKHLRLLPSLDFTLIRRHQQTALSMARLSDTTNEKEERRNDDPLLSKGKETGHQKSGGPQSQFARCE